VPVYQNPVKFNPWRIYYASLSVKFLLFLALPLAAAEKYVVKHVVDGDTIVVQSGAAPYFCA
jgi:hypothetical protein